MRWIELIRVATLVICLMTLLIGLNRNKARAEDKVEIKAARHVVSPDVSLIELKYEHLTVKVKEILLKELLSEIAYQGDLTVVVNTSLKERVTVEFHGVPLEEGLQRILMHHSFALEYGEKTQSAVLLPRKLWIFSKRVGKSPEQMVVERKEMYSQPAVVAEPEWLDAIMSKDPEERKGAYESIVRALPGEDPEVLEELQESLREFENAMTVH